MHTFISNIPKDHWPVYALKKASPQGGIGMFRSRNDPTLYPPRNCRIAIDTRLRSRQFCASATTNEYCRHQFHNLRALRLGFNRLIRLPMRKEELFSSMEAHFLRMFRFRNWRQRPRQIINRSRCALPSVSLEGLRGSLVVSFRGQVADNPEEINQQASPCPTQIRPMERRPAGCG